MHDWEPAIHYHDETKHHFGRYARSLGYMDWANQPDPFRRYAGAAVVELPLSADDTSPPFSDLFVPGRVEPRVVRLETVSWFFEYALGLSAWKAYKGTRWALRCNPSSGNLHPTEGYLVIHALDGLHARPAVYHYAPNDHVLERRCSIETETWAALTAACPPGTFFVGLTSIHWREAWKYGERAYRYCQHDVGHALAACAYSAAALGWRVWLIDTLGDDEIVQLLGLNHQDGIDPQDREEPDLLLAVVPGSSGERPRRSLPGAAIEAVGRGPWEGRPNRLSVEYVPWPLIDEVAEACRKPATGHGERSDRVPAISTLPDSGATVGDGPSAWRIIRQRRSAVDMDGRTAISASAFHAMLGRTLPDASHGPLAALGDPACIHLGLFVHRVEGTAPGLYVLVRDARRVSVLRSLMKPSFEWERPAGCPEGLSLFRLVSADCREAAGIVSCGQAIAADGTFSLGMIAEFEGPLREHGAWFYRRLFWEAGFIGQILYLEAEAAGVRSTGIGCFFDDPVHEVFGLTGHAYQSLYHFTVGGAVEDTRLTTLPGYGEARRRGDE